MQVDGVALAPTPAQQQAWRERFAAVFFDFTLFDTPLDAHGQPATDEQVAHWIERVQLQHKLPPGRPSLAELELSQGQRKRLAFVQACLEGRDIVVFDEFTADQDAAFREHFYCRLLPELKARGTTLVVVSHDDRYWHLADRLLRMERGSLRELPPAGRPVPAAHAAHDAAPAIALPPRPCTAPSSSKGPS